MTGPTDDAAVRPDVVDLISTVPGTPNGSSPRPAPAAVRHPGAAPRTTGQSVVGVITPWNFPFAAPAIDSIPPLAGAAVIVKPSDVPPLSALESMKGLREIGAAVTDCGDFLQFTGSTRTGRRIARVRRRARSCEWRGSPRRAR
jgi:hypothetical protein